MICTDLLQCVRAIRRLESYCTIAGQSFGNWESLTVSASEKRKPEVGRRDFLKGFSALTGASMVGGSAAMGQGAIQEEVTETATPKQISLTFRLNGEQVKREIDPRTTLVDLLREQLQLTGTKKGCDHGACGACTVHVNKKRVLSCLTLAATLQDAEVTTIEGIARGEELHPMQEAFLECDAYQCGYCTPGQIMSGIACVQEGHATRDAEDTREWMSGNLCRCSAYPNILEAVRRVGEAEGH